MQAAFGGGAADVSDRLFSQSVEEFYAPPKAPDDYLKLDNEINKVLTQGASTPRPSAGS